MTHYGITYMSFEYNLTHDIGFIKNTVVLYVSYVTCITHFDLSVIFYSALSDLSILDKKVDDKRALSKLNSLITKPIILTCTVSTKKFIELISKSVKLSQTELFIMLLRYLFIY